MSLRGRLIVLLSAFALFTVVTGGAVIYGVQWHVQRAVAEFEESLGQTLHVERLRLALKEQANHLRDVIDGSTDALKPYFASRGQFLAKLAQLAMFNSAVDGEVNWSVIENLAETLIAESDRCLALHQTTGAEQAHAWFSGRIEGDLLPELDSRLLTAKTRLDEARNRATREISTTSSEMLLLTAIISATAFGLVVMGAVLIRRWLIVPVLELRRAAERFGRGEFDYRVQLRSRDELGALGTAMNDMAGSVAEAQAGLQASEIKHRLLFRNLRDAVVICDGEGLIVECHDSGTEILGVEGVQHLERPLLEVWPAWRGVIDWAEVIAAAADRGRRFRTEEVELTGADDRPVFADLVIYPVEYGGSRYAAIIVRDVTERRRLQFKLRHAETMEAVGTLASGLAHDFNNLLAGVIGSLSLVANEMSDPHLAERLRAAVQTCWQAAALSRRLLNFAGSARGEPRVFALSEAVEVIVSALDPSFLEGIDVQRDLDVPHFVRLDHDQFTQITLNVLRNAREAMPDGGTLRIRIETASRVDPNDDRTQRQYAVLVVGDTGCGMTPEAQRRIFEPFFTTKSRSSKRGRGMGMAIVHTAVRNAGGFIQIESAPDCGAVFRVHFPTCEAPAPLRTVAVPAVRIQSRAAAILLVEEDAVWRDVARKALEAEGHAVVATPGGAKALPDMVDRYRGLDVVVLDIDGLAQANGVCERLIAANPGLRFVITTAGQEKPLPDGLRERSVTQLLKPFTLEALASAVSNAQAPSETKN